MTMRLTSTSVKGYNYQRNGKTVHVPPHKSQRYKGRKAKGTQLASHAANQRETLLAALAETDLQEENLAPTSAAVPTTPPHYPVPGTLIAVCYGSMRDSPKVCEVVGYEKGAFGGNELVARQRNGRELRVSLRSMAGYIPVEKWTDRISNFGVQNRPDFVPSYEYVKGELERMTGENRSFYFPPGALHRDRYKQSLKRQRLLEQQLASLESQQPESAVE